MLLHRYCITVRIHTHYIRYIFLSGWVWAVWLVLPPGRSNPLHARLAPFRILLHSFPGHDAPRDGRRLKSIYVVAVKKKAEANIEKRCSRVTSVKLCVPVASYSGRCERRPSACEEGVG